MKSYIIPASRGAQARGLHTGEISAVWWPMKEQPYSQNTGYAYDTWVGDDGRIMYNAPVLGGYMICELMPPLAPGDILAVKEGYRYATYSPIHVSLIEYRSGGFKVVDVETPEEWVDRGRWRPAQTLPSWAIRTRREVVAVEAKRVQAVTVGEVSCLGLRLPLSALAIRDRETTPITDCPEYAECLKQHTPAAWEQNSWGWLVTLGPLVEVAP